MVLQWLQPGLLIVIQCPAGIAAACTMIGCTRHLLPHATQRPAVVLTWCESSRDIAQLTRILTQLCAANRRNGGGVVVVMAQHVRRMCGWQAVRFPLLGVPCACVFGHLHIGCMPAVVMRQGVLAVGCPCCWAQRQTRQPALLGPAMQRGKLEMDGLPLCVKSALQ